LISVWVFRLYGLVAVDEDDIIGNCCWEKQTTKPTSVLFSFGLGFCFFLPCGRRHGRSTTRFYPRKVKRRGVASSDAMAPTCLGMRVESWASSQCSTEVSKLHLSMSHAYFIHLHPDHICSWANLYAEFFFSIASQLSKDFCKQNRLAT
jgi:hypothetical protein